jgi:hypothetical protein
MGEVRIAGRGSRELSGWFEVIGHSAQAFCWRGGRTKARKSWVWATADAEILEACGES